jgi:DNA invertase Pin-like site-specific DNA recombinase
MEPNVWHVDLRAKSYHAVRSGLPLDVLKAVCELERNLIRDRVNSGLAAARAKGVRLGRSATLPRRRSEGVKLRGKGKCRKLNHEDGNGY